MSGFGWSFPVKWRALITDTIFALFPVLHCLLRTAADAGHTMNAGMFPTGTACDQRNIVADTGRDAGSAAGAAFRCKKLIRLYHAFAEYGIQK